MKATTLLLAAAALSMSSCGFLPERQPVTRTITTRSLSTNGHAGVARSLMATEPEAQVTTVVEQPAGQAAYEAGVRGLWGQ